jgi:hypothetical protein
MHVAPHTEVMVDSVRILPRGSYCHEGVPLSESGSLRLAERDTLRAQLCKGCRVSAGAVFGVLATCFIRR